jgi:hypothetical protein
MTSAQASASSALPVAAASSVTTWHPAAWNLALHRPKSSGGPQALAYRPPVPRDGRNAGGVT